MNGRYLLFIALLTFGCANKNDLNLILSKSEITKASFKVVSKNGVRYITITNSDSLNTLNQALNHSYLVNKQAGGAYPIWADVTIYKKSRSANFLVNFSEYHGWYIFLDDNETLSCKYLFDLIKSYAE